MGVLQEGRTPSARISRRNGTGYEEAEYCEKDKSLKHLSWQKRNSLRVIILKGGIIQVTFTLYFDIFNEFFVFLIEFQLKIKPS